MTAELRDLRSEGAIVEGITAAQKDEMLKIQDEVGYSSALDLLAEHFPHLLTADGKRQHEEFERDLREVRQVGEFAPRLTLDGLPPRGADEPPATPKQVAYLRDLGVRDEALIRSLGKRQASAAIERALEMRDQIADRERSTRAATESAPRSGCLGVILLVLLLSGVVWMFSR